MDGPHSQNILSRIGRSYSRVAVVLVLLFLVYHFASSRENLTQIVINESAKAHGSHPQIPVLNDSHPTTDSTAHTPSHDQVIGDLITQGEATFNGLISKQSQTLAQAAAAYRLRRGRHPPPGFDKWFEYAHKHDAVIVEEFWDQVYHDLDPFWAIAPSQIRAQARDLGMTVVVLDGKAAATTDWFWHVIWGKMINHVAHMLSDMVVPLNAMDEPRMMVPWEQISAYIARGNAAKRVLPVSQVHRNVTGWREDDLETSEVSEVKWHSVPPYSFARKACPPDAPIKQDYLLYNTGSVSIESPSDSDINQPFVVNSTLASDTCQDPAIAAYHAALISPLSASTSQTLQPLFGGSKLSVNNDILLPAPMYWNGEERFEMEDTTSWLQKTDTVVWRGTATGGRHNAWNWPHFHRHRFIALTNGTKYTNSDPEHDRIFTPAQRIGAIDPLPVPIQNNLAKWLDSINNAAFTDLFCDDAQETFGTCWYTDSVFSVKPTVSLTQQYSHKYLPDIDGNSFSGRYRSFLYSNSLPIKATLFREWHDSRLIAWKHFVPMNNRFTDYYSLLAYFIGCSAEVCGLDGAIEGHDKEAQAIAEAGAEWAKKVLRKEDMQIYVARLLLEYGRITDDQRENLGWVDDLFKSDQSSADRSTSSMRNDD